MKELLNEEQQKLIVQNLESVINCYLAQKYFIYVVLEPNLDEAIKDIFFQSNVRYKEPFMLFDTRFEDAGPRITRLGDNQKFDDWIINEAFFNRWTALFISILEIKDFSEQISYLCNAVTFDGNPVIFRSYTPTILNEWLPALQSENKIKEAIGFCSDILFLSDFPDKLNRYYFNDTDVFILEEVVILTDKLKFTIRSVFPKIYCSAENWVISEKQNHSLIIARVKYLIHRIRSRLFLNQNIRENYLLVSLHSKLIDLANLCFQYQIIDDFKVESIINLYFGYTEQWHDNHNQIISILSSSRSNENKIDSISELLYSLEEK